MVQSYVLIKRDNFDFVIVNYPCLDGDVPLSPSYGTMPASDSPEYAPTFKTLMIEILFSF